MTTTFAREAGLWLGTTLLVQHTVVKKSPSFARLEIYLPGEYEEPLVFRVVRAATPALDPIAC